MKAPTGPVAQSLRRAAAALSIAADRFFYLWANAGERFPEWYQKTYPMGAKEVFISERQEWFVADLDALSDVCAFAAQVLDPTRRCGVPQEAPGLLPGESGRSLPGIESAAAFLRVAAATIGAEEFGDDPNDGRRQWFMGLLVCLQHAWDDNLQAAELAGDADNLIAPGTPIYEAAAALVDAAVGGRADG